MRNALPLAVLWLLGPLAGALALALGAPLWLALLLAAGGGSLPGLWRSHRLARELAAARRLQEEHQAATQRLVDAIPHLSTSRIRRATTA